MVAFFSMLLLIWSLLDHAIPSHDAAAHSGYSSMVRQLLTHTREWNIVSLTAILKIMPFYPAGVWFLNGFCKAFIGESHFAEQVILTGYLALLSLGVWSSTYLLLRDKFKATLAVFFLNTCPVILYLGHSPYIDLPFVSMLSLFCSSAIYWWQKKDWKSTALMSLLFGISCICKQLTLMYSLPLLAVLGLICLLKRDYRAIAQLIVLAISTALFLSTWVIPNYQDIVTYSHNRSAYASANYGFWQCFAKNILNSFYLSFQSISLGACGMALFAAFNLSKNDWKRLAPLMGSIIFGIVFINWIAYYNAPESRYFAPLAVALCIILGAGTANYIRSGRVGQIVSAVCLLLLFVQSCCLSFTALPPRWTESSRIQNPAVFLSGIRERNMLEHLPYVAGGDAWKQEWLFNLIESRDGKSPVYLNVLSNSKPYNLGSISFVGRARKSHVKPTSWRGCGPDMRDTFGYSAESPSYMHWIIEKTGDENGAFFDEQSRLNYLNILQILKQSGHFLEIGRQPLPDGTELIVYRNRRLP